MQESFKPLVVAQRGFSYKPERPNATEWAQQKWGWSGTRPGELQLAAARWPALMARDGCLWWLVGVAEDQGT